MQKQVFRGRFGRVFQVCLGAAVVLGSVVTNMSAFADEVLVLKLSSTSQARLSQMKMALMKLKEPYTVVTPAELVVRRKAKGMSSVMLPLPASVEPGVDVALKSFLGDGGRVIILPPVARPDASVLRFMTSLGAQVEGFYVTTTDLLFKGAPERKGVPNTLLKGSYVFRVKQGVSALPLAWWGSEVPAIVKIAPAMNITLVNWPWAAHLAQSSVVSVDAKQVLKADASTEREKQAVVSHSKLQGLSENIPAPTSVIPPPPDLVQTPGTANSMPSLTVTTGGGDKTIDKNADPLLNDRLMDSNFPSGSALPMASSGEKVFAPIIQTGGRAGTLEERLKRLDWYHHWVEDAVDSSLQLGLSIDSNKVQQNLVEADMRQVEAVDAIRRGKYWEAEYLYDKAYTLINESLILTSPSQNVEGRAIWLDRGSIVRSKNPRGLRKLMKRLADSGINIVYFETFNAGFPMYPDGMLPQNPLVKGWDPLAVAVDEAHKRNMELHAWMWTFAVGNTKHNPLISKGYEYAGPVLEGKGLMSEALRTASGSIMPPRQTEYWLSPASPKAKTFLKDLFKEVVTRYNVDGLQLDYIRYPFQRTTEQVGYERVSRSRFHQQRGTRTGLKSFVAWKTLQVNNFVKEVSQELKAVKPDLKLSAAVFPMRRGQRIWAIQQDWETWVNNGWVDTLSPMIYTPSRSLFESTVKRVLNSTRNKVMVYPGVAIFRLDAQEMLGHLEAIREQGGMGSTLFANAHLSRLKQSFLKDGPYKHKQAVPPHRAPLKMLKETVKTYETYLNRLQQEGELVALPLTEKRAVDAQLQKMTQLLASLTNEHEKPSVSTMASVRTLSKGLKADSFQWLEAERKAHPFRAQLFQDLLIQMEQLLTHWDERTTLQAH